LAGPESPGSALARGVAPVASPLLLGCDFSSSPSRRKPIVMATGTAAKGRLLLAGLECIEPISGS